MPYGAHSIANVSVNWTMPPLLEEWVVRWRPRRKETVRPSFITPVITVLNQMRIERAVIVNLPVRLAAMTAF